MIHKALPVNPLLPDPRKEPNFLKECYPSATGETNYLQDQASLWQEWIDHYLHLYYYRNLLRQTNPHSPIPLADLLQTRSQWENLHGPYGFLADPIIKNQNVIEVYFSYPSKHRWAHRYSSRIAVNLLQS